MKLFYLTSQQYSFLLDKLNKLCYNVFVNRTEKRKHMKKLLTLFLIMVTYTCQYGYTYDTYNTVELFRSYGKQQVRVKNSKGNWTVKTVQYEKETIMYQRRQQLSMIRMLQRVRMVQGMLSINQQEIIQDIEKYYNLVLMGTGLLPSMTGILLE